MCLCSDGGSDSSVSDGPPVHLQYNAERVSGLLSICTLYNLVVEISISHASSLGLDIRITIFEFEVAVDGNGNFI